MKFSTLALILLSTLAAAAPVPVAAPQQEDCTWVDGGEDSFEECTPVYTEPSSPQEVCTWVDGGEDSFEECYYE